MDNKEVDLKKDYVCIKEFSAGTKKPRTFKKDKTYKFPEDVGKFYIRKGNLKNK